MKITKYIYEWIVQGHYNSHGWEDIGAHASRKVALFELNNYNANERNPHRIIYRRTLRTGLEI